MRPVKRSPVSKHGSAHKFRRNVQTTRSVNLRQVPMRGGWRL